MEATTRAFHFLGSAGAIRAGYDTHDWSGCTIGPPACWSPALRNAASLILESEFPMYVVWGPQLIFLYNAAFATLLDSRHPQALGQPLAAVLPDMWPGVKPLIERALGGHPTYGEDVPCPVYRDGRPVTGWFTLAYSPLRDDHGVVRGVLCVTSETSQRVQLERRHALQLQVVDTLRRLHHPSDIIETACALIGKYLQLDNACYVEADEEAGSFEVIHDWSRHAQGGAQSAPIAGRHARLDDFGASTLSLLRTGAPLAVHDTEHDARTPAAA
jgi:hypothetical protein